MPMTSLNPNMNTDTNIWITKQTQPRIQTVALLLPECKYIHQAYYLVTINYKSEEYKSGPADRDWEFIRVLSKSEISLIYCMHWWLLKYVCYTRQTKSYQLTVNIIWQGAFDHKFLLFIKGIIVFPDDMVYIILVLLHWEWFGYWFGYARNRI